MHRINGLFFFFFTISASLLGQPNLTLEDIWASGKFSPEYVYGLRSMKDGLHYTTLEQDRGGKVINKYSYETGELIGPILQSITLIPEGEEKPIEIANYSFSADEAKVLIGTEEEGVYRRSTKAHYYVYDLEEKTLTKLTEGAKQRLAVFSPSGNKIAFMKENNLYIKDLSTGSETQITSDGKWNHILNGGTDWVYEEEFAFDQAFFWSPDGKSIAFLKFDESNVKQFTMALYGDLYPEQYQFKYPKAGEENAKVSLHLYDLNSETSQKVTLPKYEYIPRIKWANASQLSVITMNRHQNNLNLYLVDAKSAEAQLVLNETSSTYIDVDDDLTFLPKKKGFLWTSDKSGYKHIYHYDLNGKNEKQLTKGAWQVDEFLGYDETNQTLYYTSTEISPLERHLYRITLSGLEKKKLTKKSGWNNINFSNGFKYFINYQSAAGQPYFISLHNHSGKQIRTLKDNDNLNATLKEFELGEMKFDQVKVESGLSLNMWMIFPPNFDETKKYPLLMFVYGGPGSQTVKNSWGGRNYLWYQMMAQKGYIVASVDNRGTGARGAAFQKITYKQLGKYETQDQISAAQQLGKKPFIDENRIGIWGWSYGGYMSSLCLLKGHTVFKTAIAVAPVTNWRFYDSIYTERYMQTPQENPDGYDDNSPINHVDSLRGNYLLVHGSADDNVHLQNTMEMTNALVNKNKPFDLMVYPNKNHGIYGGYTRLHLFNKITAFIEENL